MKKPSIIYMIASITIWLLVGSPAFTFASTLSYPSQASPNVPGGPGTAPSGPQPSKPQGGKPVKDYGTLKLVGTVNVAILPLAPNQPSAQPFVVPFNSPARNLSSSKASSSAATSPQSGPLIQGPQPQAAMSSLLGWAGIGYSGTPDPVLELPPDVIGAVGPNHVFETINAAGMIWYRNGVVAKSAFSLASMFTQIPAGHFLGDPYIIYDSISNRWFVSVEDFTSYVIYLAISTSNDPTSTYYLYSGMWVPNYCPDQPYIGTNDDKFVLTFNLFSSPCFTAFVASYFVAFSKAQMITGQSTINYGYADDSSWYTIRPARHLTSTAGVGPANGFYLASVGETDGSGNSIIRVLEVYGLPPGGLSYLTATSIISPHTIPPDAAQPGTAILLATGDQRAQSVVWEMVGSTGFLYLTANDACTPSGDSDPRSCIRFIKYETDPGFQLFEDDTIARNGVYYFYPAVSVNSRGDIVLTFGESSTSIYPSMLATARFSTDGPYGPTAFYDNLIVIVYGTASDLGTGNQRRYGDYFGAATDPDSLTFWVFGEYITNTGAANWSTYIAHVALTQNYFLAGSSQLWDSNSGPGDGASVALCKDGLRFSADLFSAGATTSHRHTATAFAGDRADMGPHTYSLCYKTANTATTGWVSGTYLTAAPVPASGPFGMTFSLSQTYTRGPGGDEFTSSTSYVYSGIGSWYFNYGTPNTYGIILLANAQIWSTSSAVAATLGICRDGTLISGEMNALGATATHRHIAGAIAFETNLAGIHQYGLCFRSTGAATAYISGGYFILMYMYPAGQAEIVGPGTQQSTTSTSFVASSQTALAGGDGYSQLMIFGSAVMWDSNTGVGVGASVSICRNGVRIAGDLFSPGATSAHHHFTTPMAVDLPPSGVTPTYSLCYKTATGGTTAYINQDSLLIFVIAQGKPVLFSGPHGDQGTASTIFTPSLEQFTFSVGGSPTPAPLYLQTSVSPTQLAPSPKKPRL